jgi:hypothetical protein
VWGHWFIAMSAGVLLVLLVIASAFLGSPLLALLVAAVGLGVIGVVYGLRRAGTREPTVAAGRADNPLTNPRKPTSGGAPVAGEGSEPAQRG